MPTVKASVRPLERQLRAPYCCDDPDAADLMETIYNEQQEIDKYNDKINSLKTNKKVHDDALDEAVAKFRKGIPVNVACEELWIFDRLLIITRRKDTGEEVERRWMTTTEREGPGDLFEEEREIELPEEAANG